MKKLFTVFLVCILVVVSAAPVYAASPDTPTVVTPNGYWSSSMGVLDADAFSTMFADIATGDYKHIYLYGSASTTIVLLSVRVLYNSTYGYYMVIDGTANGNAFSGYKLCDASGYIYHAPYPEDRALYWDTDSGTSYGVARWSYAIYNRLGTISSNISDWLHAKTDGGSSYSVADWSKSIFNRLGTISGNISDWLHAKTDGGSSYSVADWSKSIFNRLGTMNSNISDWLHAKTDGGSSYSVADWSKFIFDRLGTMSSYTTSWLSTISSQISNLNLVGGSSSGGGSGSLPAEYKRLEYIETSGTQYINTNLFYDSNKALQADFDIVPLSSSSRQMLMGYYSSGTSKVYCVDLYRNSSSPISMAFGGTFLNSSSRLSVGVRSSITSYAVSGEQYLIVDGNTVLSGSVASNFIGNRPFYLFASNDVDLNDAYALAKVRCYGVVIKCDGSVVRNYVPAVRYSDNQVGLYDLVEQVFYVSSGSGSFIPGPEMLNWELSNYQAILSRLDTIISNQNNGVGSTGCNHHYVSEINQDPTCVLPGLMVYTCDYCGASYSEILESLGHDWLCTDHVEPVKDSDGEIVQSGYDIYRCQICDRTYYDYDGTGAPDDESGSTITDLITQLFAKLGNFIGGLISSIINLLDKLLTGFDQIVTEFNERTNQILDFGGAYPAWLGGVWAIIPQEMQLALGFCIVVMALGIIGKKVVFS